ncbi:DUF3365 domain-containing protein [Desulfovibrio sp. OttesenSCG-928-F07]|nr:DUF3365 domain-containing protein [Desulfovibrio sp. OttesenSCG-928-F07]
MRLLPATLQRRFLVGLLFIVLVTASFFFIMLNNHIKEIYISEAHAKADLMAAHTEAIQHYVRSVLRPIVSDRIGMDEFVIEAMSSSYVTRNILSELNVDNRDFIYRRVAKNARNPESEINSIENDFLFAFKQDHTAKKLEEIMHIDNREYLVVARPVYFTFSCMRCHGDPKDAPPVLLEMYGAERGFWRETGDLAGLDIVSVPLESAASGINKSVTMFSACFAAGMLLLLLSVQGFFNRLVVHNLRRVGHILHQNLFQEESNEVLSSLRKEVDIETMIHSIAKVANHLHDARVQLNDYTKNLELMVAARTSDLETIVQERSADVHLFMQLLSNLNTLQDKHSVLNTALHLIGSHFAADKAIYVCGVSAVMMVEWPVAEHKNDPDSPVFAELKTKMKASEAEEHKNRWFLPVQTSGQTRGMLGLYWNNENNTASQKTYPGQDNFQLAQAFGRQLGIALDNIDAIDALLRQNNLLDSIVEGVNDPLILVEGAMKPVLSNSSARTLASQLAASASAPRGADNIEDLLHMLALNTIRPLNRREAREVTVEGRSFMVNLHPLLSAVQGVPRAVVHLRETTEEKRMLAHIRQSEKLAAVGQLAAGLAHEINNPLGVIHCYAELLDSTELDEQRRSDISIILRHVEQARSVLKDMLDFSSARTACPGPCDIGETIASVYEIFKSQGRSGGFKLSINVEEKLPLAYVDKRMLEQVIVNLLLNAKDAVKGNAQQIEGQITIAAQFVRKSGSIQITVSDNGPGITKDILPKIFDPFFTTKGPGHGTGLGLSIAFGMVNEMRGTLEVKSPAKGSTSGRGASFIITLPTAPATECTEK